MIRLLLVWAAITLLLFGGAIPALAADDPYEGSLNRDAPRGASIVKFNVPSDRPKEICVIPVQAQLYLEREPSYTDDNFVLLFELIKGKARGTLSSAPEAHPPRARSAILACPW